MQCERCGVLMELGKETAHNGRFLCRNCFMEVLAPSGVCEAVIQRGIITSQQRRVLAMLSDNHGLDLDALSAVLDLPQADLERELFALVRREKVRDVRKDGKKVFLLC